MLLRGQCRLPPPHPLAHARTPPSPAAISFTPAPHAAIPQLSADHAHDRPSRREIQGHEHTTLLARPRCSSSESEI